MAGDTDNVAVWSEADVLLGSLTATDPATNTAFLLNADPTPVTEWDFAGILDGAAGFGETQANDSTDFMGWGVGVIASSKKNHDFRADTPSLAKSNAEAPHRPSDTPPAKSVVPSAKCPNVCVGSGLSKCPQVTPGTSNQSQNGNTLRYSSPVRIRHIAPSPMW